QRPGAVGGTAGRERRGKCSPVGPRRHRDTGGRADSTVCFEWAVARGPTASNRGRLSSVRETELRAAGLRAICSTMARPRPTREDEPAHAAGDFAAVLRGMAHRLQLPALEARHSTVWVLGLFALVNGLLSMATMAAVAVVTGAPLIFPSLRPTPL